MQHPLDHQTEDWVFWQTGQKREQDEYIKQCRKALDSAARCSRTKKHAAVKARRNALYRRFKKQISLDFL